MTIVKHSDSKPVGAERKFRKTIPGGDSRDEEKNYES
jgi:hypothetical protein